MADQLLTRDASYTLELSPPELKIVHAALRSLHKDLGHDEADVHAIVRSVLAKLPGEEEIDAIDLHLPRRHRG